MIQKHLYSVQIEWVMFTIILMIRTHEETEN